MSIRDNHDIYLTQGEADVTHTFTAYDDDDLGLDLSDPGWTAKVYAGKKGQTKIIDGELCSIIPDQVNYRGKYQFVFTGAFCSGTPIGQYEMSTVVEHSDGRRLEYPKSPNDQFGTLHITRSLRT